VGLFNGEKGGVTGMHELGVLVRVVRNVQEVAEQNHAEKVAKIVLEVGEICGAIPEYLEKEFPLATLNRPMFSDCELEIKVITAKGKCQNCHKIYWLKQNKGICPYCGSDDFITSRGTELYIKEIVAY
jgi:hydrogenase nickel incorporation protein HypA/HybF